jgi:phytoene desaturase
MENKKDIIIIGAGIGGLSAAARLAFAGFNVTVFEQQDKPGGKAGEIKESGFRFDTGPSLLTMTFVLRDLFTETGEDPEEYLNIKRPDTTCRYFWEDGTIINACSNTHKFAEEISIQTADTSQSVIDYLDYSKNIYELTAELFLFSPFTGKELLHNDTLKKLPLLGKIDPFRTMHAANKSFFNDPKTIQLFDRYATYNGSNPYMAPATLNIIQHVEYNGGAYYSAEGMYSVVKAIYKLALKKGVKFNFNSKVNKIITRNNRAAGISAITSGKEHIYNADIIISNADTNFTYTKLLNREKGIFNKLLKKEPSSSALIFYWGVKGEYHQFDAHNILFSSDYKKEFDCLFKKKKIYNDPTVYIYISSKFNRKDAPEGCENWFVMVNAPYNSGQYNSEETGRIRAAVLNKISSVCGISVSDKIIYERLTTPADIENKTSSAYGSIYGLSSNSRFTAFMRPKNRSDINGLYFCGGSAHPGGGIPLVLSSGKITAELIKGSYND